MNRGKASDLIHTSCFQKIIELILIGPYVLSVNSSSTIQVFLSKVLCVTCARTQVKQPGASLFLSVCKDVCLLTPSTWRVSMCLFQVPLLKPEITWIIPLSCLSSAEWDDDTPRMSVRGERPWNTDKNNDVAVFHRASSTNTQILSYCVWRVTTRTESTLEPSVL